MKTNHNNFAFVLADCPTRMSRTFGIDCLSAGAETGVWRSALYRWPGLKCLLRSRVFPGWWPSRSLLSKRPALRLVALNPYILP